MVEEKKLASVDQATIEMIEKAAEDGVSINTSPLHRLVYQAQHHACIT